ncbi:MAG: dockerin type I domain-containing protein [Haloarculaceae archaeon]
MDHRFVSAARRTGVVLLTIALIASAASAGATVAGPDAGALSGSAVADAPVDPRAGDRIALRAASAGDDSDGHNETDEGAGPPRNGSFTRLTSGSAETVEELDTTLPLEGENDGLRMARFPNGDLAITGLFRDLDEVYVARVGPNGSLEWVEGIGLSFPEAIATTGGGDVVVVGAPDRDTGPHLYRLSENGGVVYRTAELNNTEYNGVAVDQGNIYVAATAGEQPLLVEHRLSDGLMTDADNRESGSFIHVVVTDDGPVAVGRSDEKAYAVGYNEDFDVRWERRYGSDDPNSEDFSRAVVTPGGDVVAIGTADESEHGREDDIYLARIDDADGDPAWSERFGSGGKDLAYDVLRVGERVVALTYPGAFAVDGQTAKAYLVDKSNGSRQIAGEGFNEGDVFTAGVGAGEDRLVITGSESPDDDPDREFEQFETMLLRYRFVEEEPTVRITDATLDPSAVEDDSTVTHTLRLEVGGVSDDGNTDTFAVEFPGVVESISPNAVDVEDADGDTVPVTGAESAGNTYFFSVSPDSGAETRGLVATVSVDATYPDVDANTTAEVWAGVDDSAHGNDSIGIGLAISDAPSESDCPTIGGSDAPATDPDGDGLCEDVNGDGATTPADATLLLSAVVSGEISGDTAAVDFNGDGTVTVGDAAVLFDQAFGSGAPPATEGAPKVLIPEPTSRSVAPGESVTYEIAIGDVADGVGGYDVAVSVADPSTATITDARNEIGGTGQVEIADDGSSARIGAFAGDTADTGSAVTIATVTVTGENAGETTLSIEPTSVSGESGVDRYRIGDTSDATVTVGTPSACPAVDGVTTTDPDGDGLCEDFNGNGRLDFDDVNRFFENVSDSEVETNVAAFDFNGNDRIDFDDVNTLFDEVS